MALKGTFFSRLFSSFSFKLYAALLMVGVVPLLASYFLIERVFTFNRDLQEEAVRTLGDVSDFYRAWAVSESSKFKLLRSSVTNLVEEKLKETSEETRHIPSLSKSSHLDSGFYSTFSSGLKESLESLILEQSTLLQIECFAGEERIVSFGQVPESPEGLKLKYETIPLSWSAPKEYGVRLFRGSPGCSQADADSCKSRIERVEIDRAGVILWENGGETHEANEIEHQRLPFGASLPPDPVPISLRLVYGIDRGLSDKYELLGEKRFIHRGLTQMETGAENSISSLYRQFYLLMSAIVLFLTVIAALLIAYPLGRRISTLSRATEKVASGDLGVKIQARGRDELGLLMGQFNQMVEEIRTAQEARAYVERMQAWQEVARRLAHEIKNPLTPLLLAMQQLDRKFDDYKESPDKYRRLVTDAVEIVREEAETLQKLVREFSEFARLPAPEKKPAQIIDFIQQTIQLNPQLSENAQIEILKQDSFLDVTLEFDHELMRRVFVNLIRNGIEAAINAGTKPEISISFSRNEEKQSFTTHITDNGPGLTPEQREKLFTPYFTTKSDGTGLGLPIVRKICQDHGGNVYLQQRDDEIRGCRADVQLPL